MPGLLARKKLIIAKLEATPGVDSVPTGAANAIQTSNLALTPLNATILNRDLDRATFGNDGSIHAGRFQTLTFDVEIAGSGTSGAGITAPAWGPILQACGFAENVILTVGVERVEYDPVSAALQSLSIYFAHDGQRHILLFCRGNVSMKFERLNLPMFSFSFTGLYADPASVSDPVPDFSNFVAPLSVGNVNTPTFTLHGQSPNLESLTIDMKNQVTHRDVVGQESVLLVDRAPDGNVVIESDAISTFNWFSEASNDTPGALQLIHGTADANRVQVDSGITQVLNPSYGDSDGVSTTNMGLSVIPTSAGDDEIKITTN